MGNDSEILPPTNDISWPGDLERFAKCQKPACFCRRVECSEGKVFFGNLRWLRLFWPHSDSAEAKSASGGSPGPNYRKLGRALKA
jgi:hypothetical protein